MDEMAYDSADPSANMDQTAGSPESPTDTDDKEDSKRNMALLKSIVSEIKADSDHHAKCFKQMRDDMYIARHGADKIYPKGHYKANIIGRHIKSKTATLYAKNPRIVAKRRETLDFAVWDETPATLQIAQQVSMMVQQAVAQAQATPPMMDPMTGMEVPVQPQLPPGAEQALALMQDVQQGVQRREFAKKYAKTFELLIGHALHEQKPLDFKEGMKIVVRRTVTSGVGYVELGYQRQYGPRPGMTEKLADARARLDHLRRLTEELGEGEIGEDDAEMAELDASVASLQSEPEIVLRQGLILDYPMSTKVIPDRLCTNLRGFVNARHITIEYNYTTDQVEELFGVDVSDDFTAYKQDGEKDKDDANVIPEDSEEGKNGERGKNSLVKVWKYYDKPSGLVYYIADGHKSFLRPPSAPEVFVEDFWPIYALVFNDVESEEDIFPPSDVELLLDMQSEYNRSRQGMREHRRAARPRWVYSNGVFSSDQDPEALAKLEAFQAIGLNVDPQFKIQDVLQVVPVPGVDPNLYETNQLFTDMQLVSGAQEAQYGATTDATATQSAIAANATGTTDGSSIDDLDGFLTRLARAGGQILQREMPEEEVVKIVGPGAVWPQQTQGDIVEEIFLEVEAGSTGRPNQAVEVNNWQRLAPIVMQIPGVNPEWLARETLRRMDDKLDLTDAITAGIPSIVASNGMMQANAGSPAEDPNAQGQEGANNAKKPEQPAGSDAPMGDNRTTPGQMANDPSMG